MNEKFEKLFKIRPYKEDMGICFFGGENDGDCFDERDFSALRNGKLDAKWKNSRFLDNHSSRQLLETILKKHEYVIDLASGTGMGLVPSLKHLDPRFPCMVSDANPGILYAWKEFIRKNDIDCPELAQFSVFDLPFVNDSVQAFCSFIGLSSTRNGEEGYKKALAEIYRTLSWGGCFYTIECEWTNADMAIELFKRMNMQPWKLFTEDQLSWHDRFSQSGFDIVYEEQFEYHVLNASDNDLGEAAEKYGVELGQRFTAFIVSKRLIK